MDHRELDPAITVAAGIELAPLWDRFEIFEALHHTMTIDNPMTSADLDQVVELLSPTSGERALDLACGHGELLRRLRAKAAVSGRGVDLSPWMLRTAHRLTTEQLGRDSADGRGAANDITWVIDEARDHGRNETFNLTACLGASWVWHGFAGTVRALAERTAPGGRIAIGDMHLRDGLDANSVTESHGAIESIEELEASFDTHGLDLLGRVNTTDDAWDEYIQRTREAALLWAETYPGERSASFVSEQAQWQKDHARDREILTWSVWVATKR